MAIADGAGLASLFAAGYVATNLDNLLLMVLLLGSYPQARLRILAGSLAAAGVLLAACLAAVVLGTLVDPALLGYLGIVPVALGLRMLHQRNTGEAGSSEGRMAGVDGGWFSTSALLLGNSGDTLAVFVPLFAESDPRYLGMELGLFAAMALVWTGLALAVSSRLGTTRRIVQAGERLVPWIMLLAGGYVLLDTATDSLL